MSDTAAARAGRRSRRSLLIELMFFGASTALFQATRLAVGLVAAAVVLPERYALWGIALVILAYSTYATVGVLSGANRQIPISIGGDDLAAADRAERAAFGWAIACFAALTMGGLVAIAWLPPEVRTGGALLVAAISLQQIYLFYQTSLRARLEFNRASTQQLLIAVVFLVSSLALVAAAGVDALLVGQSLAFAVGIVLVWTVWRRALRPAWDPAALRRLVLDGFPIMAAGILFTVTTTADRWLVLALLGEQSLGHYALAAQLSSVLLFVAIVVAQHLYPRMAMRYGETGQRGVLWPLAIRQSLVALALTLPVAIIIIVAAPALIVTWLPAYLPSIGAVQMLAIAFILLVACSGFSNALIVAGYARAYALILLACLAVLTFGAVAAVSLGLSLTGIAAAAAVAYGLLSSGLVTAARWVTRDAR